MELPIYPDDPAVYFLAHGDRIVYVGKTQSMKTTWQANRHRDKVYDRLFCVVVDANELDAAEQACIVYFRPKYNTQVFVKKVPFEVAEEYASRILRGTELLNFPRNENPGPGEKGIHIYEYPRPSVTVDIVVFGFDKTDTVDPLKLLLIRRAHSPFAGAWALPGGFVNVSDIGDQGEDLEEAARRELKEESDLTVQYLEQLYTYGTPKRDPRGRVISVAYLALVPAGDHSPVGGDDASDAKWIGVKELGNLQLAFDHDIIVTDAVRRLRAKIRYAPIGLNLLPKQFSLSELRLLYEGILGQTIDAPNFSKRVLATHVLVESGQTSNGAGRPARLYSFDEEQYRYAMDYGRFNLEFGKTNIQLGPEKWAPTNHGGIELRRTPVTKGKQP